MTYWQDDNEWQRATISRELDDVSPTLTCLRPREEETLPTGLESLHTFRRNPTRRIWSGERKGCGWSLELIGYWPMTPWKRLCSSMQAYLDVDVLPPCDYRVQSTYSYVCLSCSSV